MRRIIAILAAVLLAGCATTAGPGEDASAPTVAPDGTLRDRACPLCGGALAKVGSITDDRSKPSLNVCVWNRSSCGNMMFGGDSVICTRCWQAYSEPMKKWEHGSEFPDSFYRPLSAAVREFPLPPAADLHSGVDYYQYFSNGKWSESICFWCTDSADLINGFRSYAEEHGLSMQVDHRGYPIAKQACVTVETR